MKAEWLSLLLSSLILWLATDGRKIKMARKKLIIDSDAGVDDSMAILMALSAHKKEEVEVLAITATAGNTALENVEINILRTLDIAGCEEIPVFRGASEALVVPCEDDGCHDRFHGLDGFNDVKFSSSPDRERISGELAWNAMIRLSKEFPGEVTIVGLGPLTNIATAIKADPGLSKRVKEIFIMGGNMNCIGNVKVAAEFNFHTDPEAAYVVLRLAQCPLYVLPWEVCLRSKLEMTWRRDVMGNITSPSIQFLNMLEEKLMSTDDDWYILADQLVMMAAIDRNTVTKITEEVAMVELKGDLTRGMMVLDRREGKGVENMRKNAIIIQEMDKEILKKQLIDSLKE